MKKWLLAIVLVVCYAYSFSQELTYYFDNTDFDQSIPSPKNVLGFEIGEFHLSHDQIIRYLEKLAESSDRIQLTEYARSHEKRPLIYLSITSQKNQSRINEIHNNKKQLSQISTIGNYSVDEPVVIYQGFSIHGDEASGANAAILYAYYLAASNNSKVIDYLNNTIVLLDPCMNPDGVQRFSTWVNMHKSKHLNSDPAIRELNQVWPRGRTNHYWFDLNRDWLLVQNPESQGRVKLFQSWKPVVLTDHHEMGTNSSYFFQPGISSRVYPRTPIENQSLCLEISRFHETDLDKIKTLYYSQESFDDFYIGKGSTYPDINGCIGILFEQASARGHLQESKYGVKSFPFAIKNQLTTAISTLKASSSMANTLNSYQNDFYNQVLDNSKQKNQKYLLGSKDAEMLSELKRILTNHAIQYSILDETIESKNGNIKFEKGRDVVIPLNQSNQILIQSIFEDRTEFEDSLFYDVSAWNIAHALNLNFEETSMSIVTQQDNEFKEVMVDEAKYAYSFSLQSTKSYKMAFDLLSYGIRLIVSSKDFVSRKDKVTINRGSIIISLENQSLTDEHIYNLINEKAKEYGITIRSLNSGSKLIGVNPGSPSHNVLRTPHVAMLVGKGVTAYDAGEIWHLFDQKLDYPISLIDTRTLSKTELNRYNTIILVNGRYSTSFAKSLKTWLKQDRVLITIKNSNEWLKKNDFIPFDVSYSFDDEKEELEEKVELMTRPYNMARNDNGAKYLGGAIFQTKLDLSHPLNYGYCSENLAIFKSSPLHFSGLENVYSSPSRFNKKSLLSGYSPPNFEENIAKHASVVVSNKNGGIIISFSDNPVFRSYFRGTERQLLNSILLGSTLNYQTME